MEQLMNELQPLIINAAVVILTGIAGYVGNAVRKWLKSVADTNEKKKVVETTCKFINQVYKDLEGPKKFEKAKENILEQLNEKGIKITDLELEVLIESTVNGFKDGLAPVQTGIILEETTNR